MRTVSDRFATAVTNSNTLALEVQVLTPQGPEPIDVLDGSVVLDATAASRGRVDLTVPVEYAPEAPSDLLAPYGNEIKVSRGVQYDDGSTELVSLGVFRIESADVTDTGDEMTVQITGVDRSIRIIEAVFEDAFSQAAGVQIQSAIEAIILEVYPDIGTLFSTTSLTTPALVAYEGDDRWDFVQGLAEAMGCNVYFDGDGQLILAPAPTGLSPAVATFTEGEDATLLSASRSWSREDAVTRVVVTGAETDATGDVPRGEAEDDSPTSPTHHGGRFGRKTFAYSSEYITTDAQAAHVAQTILQQKLGTSELVTFDSLINPAIEPYDVVHVRRERSGIDQPFILDSVTYPLTEGSMSATTRAVNVR